jgi:hypothetical protein
MRDCGNDRNDGRGLGTLIRRPSAHTRRTQFSWRNFSTTLPLLNRSIQRWCRENNRHAFLQHQIHRLEFTMRWLHKLNQMFEPQKLVFQTVKRKSDFGLPVVSHKEAVPLAHVYDSRLPPQVIR